MIKLAIFALLLIAAACIGLYKASAPLRAGKESPKLSSSPSASSLSTKLLPKLHAEIIKELYVSGPGISHTYDSTGAHVLVDEPLQTSQWSYELGKISPHGLVVAVEGRSVRIQALDGHDIYLLAVSAISDSSQSSLASNGK